MPEVKLSEFVTLVELSELYTGSLVKLPIIKGLQKQGDAPCPQSLQLSAAQDASGKKGKAYCTLPTDTWQLYHLDCRQLPRKRSGLSILLLVL